MNKNDFLKMVSLDRALYTAALMLLMAAIINIFFLQSFWITSGSMEPTLVTGDRIIAAKYSYWVRKPERGDLIVFKYPKKQNTNVIKRVIGMPGEKVEIKKSNVYIDDVLILEPYIRKELYPDYGPVKVPENRYFVLGDNRDNSADSRAWGFLEYKNIIGKLVYRYWPLQKITLIS